MTARRALAGVAPDVPSRILCPECETAFAYSPALLGKTVQCRQCAHRFEVTGPPADEPATIPAEPPDAAPRSLTPPPLPARVVKDRPAPPVTRWAGSRVEPDPEPDPERPRRRAVRRERAGSTGALVGLAAVCLLGFVVLLSGVTYLLWPGAAKPATAAAQGAAPAVEVPVAAEPAKRFEDIVREAPRRDGDPGPQPGPPHFAPPGMPPVLRPRAAPAFPGVGGPPPPPGDGPKFAAAVPLAVKPPAFAGNRTEVPLGGPVDSAAVAGGGRLLLVHVAWVNKVLVFDVSQARVIKEIDAPDPKTLLAGGMNLFVVYHPGKNLVERWSCDRLERLPEIKSPFTDPVRALAMGSAANGPLVAVLDGRRDLRQRGAPLAYFDPATLRPAAYDLEGQASPFVVALERAGVHLRVSANGRLVTVCTPDRALGVECTVLAGRRATRYWGQVALRLAFPSPDGQALGGFGRFLRPDPPDPAFDPIDPALFCLPAVAGDRYLVLRDDDPGRPRGQSRAARVQIGRAGQMLADLGRLDDVDFARAQTGDIDQTLFLVPDAKVLVSVAAPKRNKLVVRRVEVK